MQTPKDVLFPLSEIDNIKFHVARETLVEFVMSQNKQYDLKNEDTKKKLREQTTVNQEKMRQVLIAAVKKGMSLEQARAGIAIAQFEALDMKIQEVALAKSKKRLKKMPQGARDRQEQRLLEKHKQELADIKQLKTDKAKEDWVNKRFSPAVGKFPKLLE